MLKILCLFFLSFLLGTSEFLVIGILPEIANSYSVSLFVAGYSISFFAIAYAIGTPFVSAYSANFEKKHFLCCAVGFFSLLHFVCAIVPNYTLFLGARIIIAILCGAILSLSMTYVKYVTQKNNEAKVIAIIFTGFSIASVFGVLFATSLSYLIGWQYVFVMLGLLSFAVIPLLYYYLPTVEKEKTIPVLAQFSLFTNKKILYGVLGMLFSCAGIYTFYTYINPILQDIMGVEESNISLILFGFGFATLLSNILSGFVAKRYDMRNMYAVYGVETVVFLLLFVTTHSFWGISLIFCIGIIMYIINSPSQIFFLNVATKENPQCVNLASSLSPVFFNMGIAMGSFSGGLVVDTWGLQYVMLMGIIFFILACFACVALRKQYA